MPDLHWENLKEIFHAAAAQPVQERAAYLEQACGGDASIRTAVESLIRSHEETGNFVDTPAYEAAAEMLVDDIGLEAGQIVSHYRILSLIGEGGMGKVYLAEDTRLHRRVSLKFLSSKFTQDPERLRRFDQEARAASALNHPNILTIHEISEADGHRFIATEFIEGKTLRQRMQSAMEIDNSLEIATQVAAALVAAHRVGIVHRDIKPENIMIRGDDGLVKVLDFGLAKISVPRAVRPVGSHNEGETPILENTGPGVVIGTVAYMSPEQARGSAVDERTDIWSLGVVLYEMLAGSSPFVAGTSNEIISGILSIEPAPPCSRYSRLVPEPLEEIVEKALAKNREQRYQTSKDLLVDLQGLKQSLDLKAGMDLRASSEKLKVLSAVADPGVTVVAEVRAGDNPEVAEKPISLTEIVKDPPAARTHHRTLADTSSKRAASGLGILALSVLVGTAGYYLWAGKLPWKKEPKQTFSIENIKVTNLTTTGDVYAPVISPDGKYLAYCSGPKLYVRQMATGSIIEIPPPLPAALWGTLHYWGIIFSADSSQIYFTIADDGENVAGTLFRVPVLGGHSQKIVSHVNSGGHESPDGKTIVFVRADQGKGVCHLMISDNDGTNEQILSTMDMNSLYASLDWSSDSASILYAFRQHTADGYIHYVAEIPATGGAESRVTPPRSQRILSAHWLPDKSGLIITAIDPETQLSQIYYVSEPGGEERRITNDLNNYRGVSIARDGRTLIAQASNATTHLWSAPSSDPGRAVPLASSTKGSFQGVSWLPDNELVYDSYEGGLIQIFKMTREGSHIQQVTNRLGHNSDPSVTPDGRFIAFCSTRSGTNQIWRMNANGDDPVELTHSTLNVFKPQSSPDSQWVYYTTDVHGSWQVRKVPIAGGEETVVEDGPVQLWAISPDGKMLAFSFLDEQRKNTRIAVRRLDASEPFKYFDISPGISLQWTRDGRALSYVQPISGNANIWLQPLDGKPPRPLTALSADEWIATYAWSLDGKTLAYTRINTTFDAALMELK